MAPTPEVEQLCDFLTSPQPKVSFVAASAFAELSSSAEGTRKLQPHADRVCVALLGVLKDPKRPASIRVQAGKALVNLAGSEPPFPEHLLRLGALEVALNGTAALSPARERSDPGAGRDSRAGSRESGEGEGAEGEKEGAEVQVEELRGQQEQLGLLQALQVMLLANMSQHESAALALVEAGQGNPGPQSGGAAREDSRLVDLVRLFCSGEDRRGETGEQDAATAGTDVAEAQTTVIAPDAASSSSPLDHVGTLLVNITRTPQGRTFVFENEGEVLQLLLPAARLPKGAAMGSQRLHMALGAIRNCMFDAQTFLPELLLAAAQARSGEDVDGMPRELAGPLSKPRTPVLDVKLKCQALDAVLLLISQEGGRQAFWSVNGPQVLQWGYQEEEDPQAVDAFERVGAVLVESGGLAPPNETD